MVVYVTFAIGSGLAAFAGVIYGLYYNELSFNMGLLLGPSVFRCRRWGFGNIYGAIVGGFLFALLQTVGAAALPFASAYKDVFAFGVVIVLIAIKPTGLLGEKERKSLNVCLSHQGNVLLFYPLSLRCWRASSIWCFSWQASRRW